MLHHTDSWLRWSAVLGLAATGACTTGSGSDDVDGADQANDDSADQYDAAPPPCLGVAFAATASDWAIPYPTGDLANSFHAVLDLDGDGLPDLVQHTAEYQYGDDDPGLGVNHWRVFRNTGDGFAATASDWAIPYPTDDLANSFHAVLDLDGDGLADLVQHTSEYQYGDDDPGLGVNHWRVFSALCD